MSNTFYLQKRVLVSGGAGFIGSQLVEYLVKQGAMVTVVDDLSTGSMDNIAHVVKDIVFIHGDITSFQTCLASTQGQSVLFHLAAIVSVPDSMLQPRLCFNANIKGTYNLLEAARINRVERFIFSSSAAVYGEHEGECCEQDACKPQSPYGLSKLIGEQLCCHYYELFNVHTLCLRYFNVYSANKYQKQTSAYGRFKAAVVNNEPITIFGDGSQMRDFTDVQEIVRANSTLAQLPPGFLNGQPVNIASGQSRSVLSLVEQLKNEFPDSISTLSYQPARAGDIKHSVASVQKYRQLCSSTG